MVNPAERSLVLLPFDIPTQPSQSMYTGEPQSWEVGNHKGKGVTYQGPPAVLLHPALGDTLRVSLTLDCQSTQ